MPSIPIIQLFTGLYLILEQQTIHLTSYSTYARYCGGHTGFGFKISIEAIFSLQSSTIQSLLPTPELTANLRTCCRLQSLLPSPEFAAVSRVCCRLQSFLPPPELAAVARACYR